MRRQLRGERSEARAAMNRRRVLAVDLAHVCQGDVVPGEEAAVHDDHLSGACSAHATGSAKCIPTEGSGWYATMYAHAHVRVRVHYYHGATTVLTLPPSTWQRGRQWKISVKSWNIRWSYLCFTYEVESKE